MPLQLDLTNTSKAPKHFNQLQVTDLDPLGVGSGVYPRVIELKSSNADGSKPMAVWHGDVNIEVNDFVRCRKDGTDSVLIVEGVGGSTGNKFVSKLAITTKTGAYTITSSDGVILCDASIAPFTVTFPAASSITGQSIHIKKIDSSANGVTLDGNASETIDGDLTKIITMQYDSLQVVSDGSNLYII